MARKLIELMDDMHLSSQDLFLTYYQDMQANNVSAAQTILSNNVSLSDQITNAENVNKILTGVYERELDPKNDIDYFLNNLEITYENMVLNTRLRGEWDANIQYENHNFVYYNDKIYFVYNTTENPPIGTLPTDTTYWKEYEVKGFQGYGGINLNFRGNWSSTQSYAKNDVVVYKNKLWYAVAENTDYEPNLNHYPWAAITMPRLPNKTPIQVETPTGYDVGDFWWHITEGENVIATTWGIKNNEITPRFASAAFSIDDNIYVVGGRLGNFDETNVNEAFNTTSETWESKTAATTTRSRATGFAIGTNGYVVGGIDNDGNILATNEMYDSSADTWTAKADLPIPMITQSIVYDGKAYVIGGETTHNELVGNSYVYDSSADAWTAIADKPTLTRGHTVVANNGIIYAIGGIDASENTLGIVEAYDIATNTWSTKSSLITPRSYLGSFVKNDIIYAVGGLNSNWYSVSNVEMYDISTDTWKVDMPINYPRSSLNVLTNSGSGFAIGGISMETSEVNGYTEKHNDVDILINFAMIIDTSKTTTIENFVTAEDDSPIETESGESLVTEDSGSTTGLTVSIPTTSTGKYNYTVDWGDGTVSTEITTYNDSQATHTYAESGRYNIKITGQLSELKFSGTTIGQYLTNISTCSLTLSSIKNMFNGCQNLVSVPSNIFSNSTAVTSAYGLFNNCTSLQTIPVGLFENNPQITDFSYAFANSGVNAIPNGLFSSNYNAEKFTNTFKNCTNIQAIPLNLFENQSKATTFEGTFDGCTGITSIPSKLFANNPVVLSYANVFNGDSGITEISKDIFGDLIPSATNMSSAFMGTGISVIPDNMFANAPLITNYNNVFANTNADIIPINCFVGGIDATAENAWDKTKVIMILDNALQGLAITNGFLSGMTELNHIGNDIFNTNITTFENMFNGDSLLATMGNINLSNVTTTEGAFTGCTELTDITGFFQDVDHLTSDYSTLKVSTSFADCTKLTHESLLNIINSLVTLTETTKQTLTLSTESLALLNDAEKLVVINKYWDLANYTIPTITEDLAKEIVLKMYGLTDEYIAEISATTDDAYTVTLTWTDGTATYSVNRTTGIVSKQ